jgi:hypothetical protein
MWLVLSITQNFKKIIGEKDYLSQQVFNLNETGLKFKQKKEAVLAPYKAVYRGLPEENKIFEEHVFLHRLFLSMARQPLKA